MKLIIFASRQQHFTMYVAYDSKEVTCHIVLVLLLQLQTREQLTPATKTQIWHD